MLDSLYRSLFQPREDLIPLSLGGAWGFWAVLSLLEAFQWAAVMELDATGVFVLALGAFSLNVLAWLLLSALVQILAECSGGKGNGVATLGAIAAALWPGILWAPLSAAEVPLGKWGDLLGLVLFLWIMGSLVRAIAHTHGLGWGRSVLCLLGAGATATLSAVALLIVPPMILFFHLAA